MAHHTWIPIHREAAAKLLTFRERQDELIVLLARMQEQGLTVISVRDQEPKGTWVPLEVIDPFTFLASFNRGITEQNRKANWAFLKKAWDLESEIPEDFLGIPVANNMKSWWFPYKYRRNVAHVPALWEIAVQAFEKVPEDIDPEIFDRCLSFKGTARTNLTMGLFWINPEKWLSVDGVNRAYLKKLGVDLKVTDFASYLRLLSVYREKVRETFPEFSYKAWMWATRETPPPVGPTPPPPADARNWVIAPGAGARLWDECRDKGIITIGWDEVGDLGQYAEREQIREALIEQFGDNGNYMNNSLALWDFANSMNVGDVIYAKHGVGRILAKGVITSDYYFDATREEHQNVRKVDWQSTRETDLPADCRVTVKTLTQVDGYARFREFVESFYDGDKPEVIDPALRQFWWLNASQKIWDFKDMAVGSTQMYTVLNEKGNKRQKYKYFLQVRPGDLVIGYLSTPSKQIVAICEITKGLRETGGEGFEFRKLEDVPRPIAWENLKGIPELKHPACAGGSTSLRA